MSHVPKLLELCLKYLADNIEDVETFEGLDLSLKANLLTRVLRNKNRDIALAEVLKLLDENTTSIDLSEYEFSKEMPFEQVFSKMTSLTSLAICGHPNLNDIVVDNIVSWCPNLKEVNFYKNPRITDRSIALVRARCPKMEKLCARYCIGISGTSFCSEVLWRENEHPESSAANKKASKKSALIQPPPSIPFFVHLIELDISECKSIIPTKLIPFNRFFPSLKVLAIGKVFLGDEDAALIIKTFPPTLTSLDISYNPIGSKAISALCAPDKRDQFTTLNLKSCRCILSNPFLASFSDVIQYMPNLTALDLSQCYQIGENEFAKLSGYESLVTRTQSLRSLDLSHCGEITTTTIEHLSSIGLGNSLKEFRLSGCKNISDSTLLSLLEWFPNLELVDLYGVKSSLAETDATSFHAAHPKLQFRTSDVSFMKLKEVEK